MRACAALVTAVAFLANGSLALGAEGPTTPVPGYCEWSPDPKLLELTELLDDADCASRNSVRIDPHIVTNVLLVPPARGPVAPGTSEERVFVDVRYLDDAEGRGESVLLAAYGTYKGGRAAWSAQTNVVAQHVGDAQVRWFSVGPTWMRNVNATATATAIDYAGGLLAEAPAVALLPMIGPIVFIPGMASYIEDVRGAPSGIRHGADEALEGAAAGQFDRAAEGVAEVCGGTSVLISAALPFAMGAKAIAPRTTPITPFAGRVVPVVESAGPRPGILGIEETNSVGAARRSIYEKSAKHGLAQRGTAAPAPRNGQSALNSSVEFNANTSRRVGVDYDAGQFVVFDETHPGKNGLDMVLGGAEVAGDVRLASP